MDGVIGIQIINEADWGAKGMCQPKSSFEKA